MGFVENKTNKEHRLPYPPRIKDDSNSILVPWVLIQGKNTRFLWTWSHVLCCWKYYVLYIMFLILKGHLVPINNQTGSQDLCFYKGQDINQDRKGELVGRWEDTNANGLRGIRISHSSHCNCTWHLIVRVAWCLIRCILEHLISLHQEKKENSRANKPSFVLWCLNTVHCHVFDVE